MTFLLDSDGPTGNHSGNHSGNHQIGQLVHNLLKHIQSTHLTEFSFILRPNLHLLPSKEIFSSLSELLELNPGLNSIALDSLPIPLHYC